MWSIRFLFLIFLVSCSVKSEFGKPVVITSEVESITSVSAISGGEITSDGGQSVTERGIVWSAKPTPTIEDFKTVDGAGGGKFTSEMTDLVPKTQYFVRAYATNSIGTAYGLSLSFTTNDSDPTINQLTLLSKTWKATSVTLDGVDKTVEYSNFTLTLSGTSGASSFGYQTSGSSATATPWPASGNWSFGQSPTTEIIRDGGTSEARSLIYSVNETNLQITFNFSGTGYPGRTAENVSGQWVFVFKN